MDFCLLHGVIEGTTDFTTTDPISPAETRSNTNRIAKIRFLKILINGKVGK